MLDIALQLIATAMLLYGLYYMGNEKLRGPALAASAEVLWVCIGFSHGVWGLILLSSILAVMQFRNAWKWLDKGW